MATINVTAGTDYTGTPADDTFNIASTVGDEDLTSNIDAVDGEDTAVFNGLLTAGPGGFNFSTDDSDEGDYTVTISAGGNTNTYDLDSFEGLEFDNGTLDLTATPLNQQLILGSAVSGDANSPTDPEDFDIGSVLTFDGSDISTTTDSFTVASVSGSEVDDDDLVQINQNGQTAGSVRINDDSTGFSFLPTQSFINSIEGENEDVTFDVGLQSGGGDTFTQTYTVTVAGLTASVATSSADNIDGDETDNGNVPGGNGVARSNAVVDDAETFSTSDSDNTPIDGLGGNDTMTGGAGSDVFYGNNGNDNIFAGGENFAGGNDESDDLFVGGAGNDLIFGGGGNDILTGDDDNRVTGSDFDQTIDGSDRIFGGEGNDEIHTGSWSQGGDSGDVAAEGGTFFGLSDDVAYGGEGNDIIVGANGNDTLGGASGNDTINANAGNDVIYAGSGVDEINSGEGNDTIFGGAGDDVVTTTTPAVDADPDPDGDPETDDAIEAQPESTEPSAAALVGGLDNDTIFNGTGDDWANGGAGDDILWGGVGNDTLEGGSGSDNFTFVTGNGTDTILSFSSGDDQVDLSNVEEFGNFSDVQSQLGQIGGEAALFYGEDDAVIFDGVGADSLSSDDFIF